MKKPTLKMKIWLKIARSTKRNVFLRKDFATFGGYDQVGRALRLLVSEGKLIKIGYGLYAKSRLNQITGRAMIAAPGGFEQVAKESLKLLKVKWSPSKAEIAYAEGSLQMPASTLVCIKGRFNRKIKLEQYKLRVA